MESTRKLKSPIWQKTGIKYNFIDHFLLNTTVNKNTGRKFRDIFYTEAVHTKLVDYFGDEFLSELSLVDSGDTETVKHEIIARFIWEYLISHTEAERKKISIAIRFYEACLKKYIS